jgi:hypothetical protein
MCKIINKNSNITPYGGLFFIDNLVNKKSIKELIIKNLGMRSVFAKYSYFDICKSLLFNNLTQGEFLADLETLKNRLPKALSHFVPSPDTVEYASQELKVENLVIPITETTNHEINENPKFNKLLSALCVDLGLIPQNTDGLILDFDHVINENEKLDSKKTYKHTNGYNPCFANIGDLTVYFENKNGNSPAKYRQKESFTNIFKNLNDNKIDISFVRADSASYQKEVINIIEENNAKFYIRNVTSQSFKDVCIEHKTWEKSTYNYEDIETASVDYKPFGGDKSYRIVVIRKQIVADGEELFDELKYKYYGIITNDYTKSDYEVIHFYNQRGHVSENYNKNLLNDFNIKHLPHMDLDTNTVYMGFMAVSGLLFEWIKKVAVKNKVKGVEVIHRVKRFFYQYINVCAKIVNHARQKAIIIFSPIEYKFLQT